MGGTTRVDLESGSRELQQESAASIFRMSSRPQDTRSARRATRESDGFIGFVPGVGLADSANLGLSSATPFGVVNCARSGTENISSFEN